jgi:hypothetical protein
MNTMVYTHGGYLLLGIAATIWVVRTLQRGGWPFLVRWCRGDQPLADSWSHLLAVGMYLLHVGCLLLALRLGAQATSQTEAIELLGTKLGLVLLALAVTHFLHVSAFWGLYRTGRRHQPTVVDAEIVPEAAANVS